jgi:hypothetical protein
MPRHRSRTFARARALAAALGLFALAAASSVTAQTSFTWSIADRGSVNRMDVLSSFHTDIINTGSVADTYVVTLVGDMSANWLTTMCDVNLCYPPFITTLQYTVAPGASLYLGVNITPMVDGGSGTSTVTVTSTNVPALSVTASFSVLATGPEVLIVDDDGAAGAPGAVVDAVAAAGRTAGLWDRSTAGKLAAAELGEFATVVWHAGDDASGLDADDRAAISAYLAAGGRLLLCGADLAFAGCDPLSPGYAPATVAWFAATLGAGYAANASGTAQVDGVAGDPIAGGLSFSIDGAGANGLPDVLAAEGGSACLRYATGLVAGIRRQAGDDKTVFFGFGLGGLADIAARDALMDAALDWLATDASPVLSLPALPTLRLSAAPNPFNPRTVLALGIGGAQPAAFTLDIFDLRGRRVRALLSGELAPGLTSVTWDGRDDAGRPQPGGTYLARLSGAGGNVATVKIMLAK